MTLFTYILQEKIEEDIWRDVYESYDRKYIHDILIIFRKKYPGTTYRILRDL